MVKSPVRQLMLTLLASTAITSQGSALEASGSAVKVDRITNAGGPGGERLLETDGDVFMGDAIVTNANGLAQIRFVDDTRIVVGPNSKLIVDSFVFNPNNTARNVTVSAVKGVFRFISGNSPHSAYSIRTPTMAIGVRGTALDINVRGAESSVVFLSGSGTACDASGVCIEITELCQPYVAPIGGGIAGAAGQQRQQLLNASYPFIQDQGGLADGFRVLTTGCNRGDEHLFAPQDEPFSDRTADEDRGSPTFAPSPPPSPPPASPPPPSPPSPAPPPTT